MRHFIFIAAALLVTACDPYAKVVDAPVLPDGLKDCKFYVVSTNGSNYLNVVRCPNSTTSTNYTSGKAQHTTVVIDGKQYVEK